MHKLLFIFSLIAVTSNSLLAETPGDSSRRNETGRLDLSGEPNKMEVITSVAEYKKGESINLHFHHGLEAVYIVQGTTVQAPNKEPIILKSGASLINQRDKIHAGFKVIGNDSLKLFTVHIVDKNKPLYEYSRHSLNFGL